MACRAWDQIKPSTFSNCWIKTGIVPGTNPVEVLEAQVAVQDDCANDQDDVQLLLAGAFKDMQFTDDDVGKFICDPDEEKNGYEIPSIFDILTEKDLLSIDEPPEEPVEPPKVVTLCEARSAAEVILGYIKNQPDSSEMVKSVNNLISQLDLRQIDNLKQKTLPFVSVRMDKS